MLVCKTDATSRRSTICPLDEMLVKYPTEYHFLFKTLAQFEGDGTIAACYHIPNIARKVLETFTDFYVPGSESVHAKLMALEFDENKKAAILKFANDSSHRTGQGFEPGLVQESQKNTAHLMEMIKSVAPEHHKGMIDSIS
jgi:hypothetical protein